MSHHHYYHSEMRSKIILQIKYTTSSLQTKWQSVKDKRKKLYNIDQNRICFTVVVTITP